MFVGTDKQQLFTHNNNNNNVKYKHSYISYLRKVVVHENAHFKNIFLQQFGVILLECISLHCLARHYFAMHAVHFFMVHTYQDASVADDSRRSINMYEYEF